MPLRWAVSASCSLHLHTHAVTKLWVHLATNALQRGGINIAYSSRETALLLCPPSWARLLHPTDPDAERYKLYSEREPQERLFFFMNLEFPQDGLGQSDPFVRSSDASYCTAFHVNGVLRLYACKSSAGLGDTYLPTLRGRLGGLPASRGC